MHIYHDAVVEVRKQLVELVFSIHLRVGSEDCGVANAFPHCGHRILFIVCVDETVINTQAGQPA